MISSDIKALMGKMSPLGARLLDGAAGFTMTRTHYQVSVEHYLLKAIEDGSGDIAPILRYFEVDPGRLQAELLKTLEDFPSGNSGRPAFSPQFLELLEQAWILASVDMNDAEVRSGYLLMALLKQAGFLAAREYGRTLSRVDLSDLAKDYRAITRDSAEAKPISAGRPAAAGPGGDSYLAQLTFDFPAQAAEG